jgi:hypothetical protein
MPCGRSYPCLKESQVGKHLSGIISPLRCLLDTQNETEEAEILQFQSACFQLCINSAEKGCSNRRGASDCRGRIQTVMTSQQRINRSAGFVTKKLQKFGVVIAGCAELKSSRTGIVVKLIEIRRIRTCRCNAGVKRDHASTENPTHFKSSRLCPNPFLSNSNCWNAG